MTVRGNMIKFVLNFLSETKTSNSTYDVTCQLAVCRCNGGESATRDVTVLRHAKHSEPVSTRDVIIWNGPAEIVVIYKNVKYNV